MKYFDFYTGMTRGELDPKVVDTLLDQVDQNEDGKITVKCEFCSTSYSFAPSEFDTTH